MKRFTLLVLSFFVFAGVFAQYKVSDLGENNPQFFTNQNRATEAACTEAVPSNAFEMGYSSSSAYDFRTAADLVVNAGDTFTLNQVVLNVFSMTDITSVDLYFYDDNAGLPGTQIGSETGIAPTTDSVIGSNFGYDVHEVVLDLSTGFDFTAGGDMTYFYVMPVVTNADASNAFVETTSAEMYGGTPSFRSEDAGATWVLDADGFEMVYQFNGDCGGEPYFPPTGCTYYEDFEDSGMPADWSTEIIDGTADWTFGSNYTPTGDQFYTNAAVFDDDGAGNGSTNSVILYSPIFDLASIGTTTVSFSVLVGFQEAGDQEFSVEVFDGTDWQQVAFYDEDLDPDLQTLEVDASAYINSAFQVRFVYDDLGGWGWYAGVDDFCLNYDENPYVNCDIYEDFEAGTYPEFWNSTIESGDCDFEIGTYVPIGDDFGSNALVFDDDGCGSGAPASLVYVTTAAYELATASVISLNYTVGFQEAGEQTFTVEVYDGADWQQVAFYDSDLDPYIQEISIDCSTYANDDFAVRFTFNDDPDGDGTGSWGWYAGIDNFCLETDLDTIATHEFGISVADNVVDGFQMSPNPVTDVLNIKAANSIDMISVFNMLGQKVMEVTPSATETQLDMHRLNAGTYVVKVVAGEQTGSYSLIKN